MATYLLIFAQMVIACFHSSSIVSVAFPKSDCLHTCLIVPENPRACYFVDEKVAIFPQSTSRQLQICPFKPYEADHDRYNKPGEQYEHAEPECVVECA